MMVCCKGGSTKLASVTSAVCVPQFDTVQNSRVIFPSKKMETMMQLIETVGHVERLGSCLIKT